MSDYIQPPVFMFILGALATYRLSLLVSKEDGPMWLLAKLRKLPPAKSSAREGLHCTWCVSFHMGALIAGAFWYKGLIGGGDWWLYTLALSAAAIGLHQSFTKE